VPFGDALSHSPLTALATLFGAGVLTSLTPCIYPMIPITAAIVAGATGIRSSRVRAAALTLTYVLGLALLYATMGLVAGLTGSLFGTVASNPWTRGGTAAILALFGLAMLDVVPLRAPARITAWAAGLRGGSYPAVLMLGATSGIVAAPCGAPAFAAVLTWVAGTGSPTLGFLYLFVFSLGMSALLVAVGLFSGAATRLPRAGRWMDWIKRAGGVIMLGMAGYYVWLAWQVAR
jgi:thiol:disulfide interchange protein DsbD